PFGTAKWQLAGATLADALQTTPDLLPAHLDFAMARRETYAHPGALPTVTPDSIQTDLQRRDFSINALAVALDTGQLLDPFGGLDDLRAGMIRVLHDASFMDDPTRILRAVKYAARLGFTLEPHTAALLTAALPGLGSITGERIRHELTLLLVEPQPERAYADLAVRGALAAIHPALNFDDSDSIVFQGARHLYTPELAWYAWLARLTPADVEAVCARLLIGRKESDVLIAVANLMQQRNRLSDPSAKPSQLTAWLDTVPAVALRAVALRAVALRLDDDLSRERLFNYMLDWQYIRPITTGHTLQALGVAPGPRYKQLLTALRAARLDGVINDEAEEAAYLQKLLE
ncbi:MAG: CCA tRNA nucleotidyltransferase, partial [Armatimonadetes bacterium]|nr:CCA tRNA nucleotidyltransferase [Anaerolineae bacterium]